MNVENIAEHLKSHGIKPSLQRIKIYEYLTNTEEHPTVDMIYKKLMNSIPTLSKTTVYNTLNLFVENEVANVVIIEDHEARYDAMVKPHGHFKCKVCGKVVDFDMDLSKLELQNLGDIEITETHFYLRGISENCNSKN